MNPDGTTCNYESTETDYNMTTTPLAIACASSRICRLSLKLLAALIAASSIWPVNSWSVPSGHRRQHPSATFGGILLQPTLDAYEFYSRRGIVYRSDSLRVTLHASKRDDDQQKKIRSPLENDISKLLSISKDRTVSESSQRSSESKVDDIIISTSGSSSARSGTSASSSTGTTGRRQKPAGRSESSQPKTSQKDNPIPKTKSKRGNALVTKNDSTNSKSATNPRPREPRTKRSMENALLPPSIPRGIQPARKRQVGGTPTVAVRKNTDVKKTAGTSRRTSSSSSSSKIDEKIQSKSSRASVVGNTAPQNRRAASKPKKASSIEPSIFSSLLPPPFMDTMSSSDSDDESVRSTDNSAVNGLSSWEQFLDEGASASGDYNRKRRSGASLSDPLFDDKSLPSSYEPQRLPTIQDLFPPGLATTKAPTRVSPYPLKSAKPSSSMQSTSDSRGSQIPIPMKPLILDGVIPVSELFYRSSQARVDEEDEDHDDEELPFSAEQSDAIMSNENKVLVRQNLAKQQVAQEQSDTSLQETSPSPIDRKTSADRNRKMIRRGMEMLVGGIPINADPPQRSLQLMYEQSLNAADDNDWASRISLNTRAFGPLLHIGSVSKVPDFERGLFCEYFCRAAIKWDICPKDLQQIVKAHRKIAPSKTPPNQATKTAISKPEKRTESFRENAQLSSNASTAASGSSSEAEKTPFEMNGECNFEIGLTRDELESGEEGENGGIFRTVCSKAMTKVLERAIDTDRANELSIGMSVTIQKLTLTGTEDGYTSVVLVFQVQAISPTKADVAERVKHFENVYVQAMEAGDIALAIAGAAKEETRWPEAVRDRVVEECLFPDDDVDEVSELQWKQSDSQILYGSNIEGFVPAPIGSDELFRGDGDQGAFYDYSTANAFNAPYGGEIGLRLVDAVTERAKYQHPKVIAIGDVHGCIDELQDLLRQCDYRPGDLVVFLGDLVCKGPDSISVVQMAREIGAIGVRGNHDFEVVRWHHAMKSGVDPPVFGSEHYHIASCLSKADMNWMYSLPWYISSKDLGALFVHAGFVSGIRLAKQNPRLMMNMRSVLPDGTVTSKFFNNWPWARLWDGPQTVFFGHDADRGLQQYEHAIGLDTGCVYGGRLTACILPEKRLVSVSARREYFKYRRKHYD